MPIPKRSWLFVPGSNKKMLAKVPSLEADVVILDLEDGVASREKSAARALVRRAVEEGGAKARLYVRINDFGSGMTHADLSAVVVPGLTGVMLPKAGKSEELRALDFMLREIEAQVGLSPEVLEVTALIETPVGVLNAYSIALSPRVVAIALGGEDLATELGARRTEQGAEFLYARGRIVMAGAAGRVQSIDTVWTNVADEENLRRETEEVRNLGFTGKLAIHPRQVPIINMTFAVSATDVDKARRVVDAFDVARTGVISVDGKMVDEPVVRRARGVLELAQAYGVTTDVSNQTRTSVPVVAKGESNVEDR